MNKLITLLICFLYLAGCSHTSEKKPPTPGEELVRDLKSKSVSTLLPEEVDGIELLSKGQYEKAQEKFAKALTIRPQSSTAHFLNGLAHHMLFKEVSATTELDMAEVGYNLAMKFDPSNGAAAYYKGLLEFERQNYPAAQEALASAVALSPNDDKYLHALAASAYYNHDLQTALGVINKAMEKDPTNLTYLQTASLIMAALGQDEAAQSYKNQMISSGAPERQVAFVNKRLNEWNDFHQKHVSVEKAPPVLQNPPAPPAPSIKPAPAGPVTSVPHAAAKPEPSIKPAPAAQTAASAAAEKLENKMVIVDVVLILTTESKTKSTGMNLLEQLKVSFGNVGGTAAYQFNSTRTVGKDAPGSLTTSFPTSSQTMVSQISIPGIQYSLNVSNTATAKSEILARPTLIARHGKQSTFFSGSNITYSSGTANTVSFNTQKVGLTLEVTPSILEDGRIGMLVHVSRDFFTQVNENVQILTGGIQTASTDLKADVVMSVGDTLILGGLSDKITDYGKTGTTGLRDMPLLGWLFSSESENVTHSSVLVLVTPRLPQYTYQSEESAALDQKLQNTASSENTQRLKARYMDWFKPYENTGSIFYLMQNNDLYREFRTGDVNLQNWPLMENMMSQVGNAVAFVY